MKILALDIGQKSCGIATSDALQMIAHGQENFCFKTKDWHTLIKHLEKSYLQDIAKIIIGLPLLPSGDKSATTLMIEEFAQILAQSVPIDIQFVEEFGTTKKAHEIMITAGLSRAKRKKHKDKLAAVLILQDYLDRS